jgi:hypothetical protein
MLLQLALVTLGNMTQIANEWQSLGYVYGKQFKS